ncbi:hypothetical protein BN2497_5789 [Janthinobacterium sp. CG23_2]|nr:hypothetical protein BN2497_5789 [Janthinobacterium sp. CG23_2]CUU29292.1 hypothetical protein BN3177_5789 [Janthinobacterium sp. CG23_2]
MQTLQEKLQRKQPIYNKRNCKVSSLTKDLTCIRKFFRLFENALVREKVKFGRIRHNFPLFYGLTT